MSRTTLSDARRQYDIEMASQVGPAGVWAYAADDRTYAVIVASLPDGHELLLDFTWDPSVPFNETAVLAEFTRLAQCRRWH